MANCKALIAAMLLCSSFVRFLGDAGSVAPSPSPPEQEQEIQRLRAKVASLEDEISRRNEETLQLESIVRGRTAQTVALVAELDVLQKVNVADDESVMKASTQNALLEEQTERLGSDLEDQVRKGELLEVRATEAEKSLQELSRKLESFEKTDLEQKKKIRELDGKLQRAQAKLAELEKEAKIKAGDLAKVHGMWLPHWLAVHIDRCQVAEKFTHGRQFVEPYVRTAQTLAKVRINSLRNTTAPYASVAAGKTTAAYRVCRDAVQPYSVKAQEVALHHWQESRKRTQPYVDQIVAACGPHLSRANVVLEPYLRPVRCFWRRLVSLMVEDSEVLKPLSDGSRLAWYYYAAFALLTLPVLSICKILTAASRKRVRARRRDRRSGSPAPLTRPGPQDTVTVTKRRRVQNPRDSLKAAEPAACAPAV